MNTTQALTDRLLQKAVGKPLNIFISEHKRDGGDVTSLQASLLIATGHLFDRRTVDAWYKETP